MATRILDRTRKFGNHERRQKVKNPHTGPIILISSSTKGLRGGKFNFSGLEVVCEAANCPKQVLRRFVGDGQLDYL